MKHIVSLVLILFHVYFSHAQTGIHSSGRFILDKCNDTLILKGVNYPVLDDWSFPLTSEVSDQIALSNANVVRIEWYIDYNLANGSNRPAYQLSDLDTVISRVSRLGMIPVIDLHDYTCMDNLALLNNAVTFYTSPAFVALVNKHHEYLVINILNEFGWVNWAANPGQALIDFKNAYITAVNSIRSSGIHVPLLIDAPDCGTNISSLINISGDLQTSDPDHNLIFSAHAYWFYYANNNPADFSTLINSAVASNQPFILGEVANYQDTLDANNSTVYCAHALNYNALIPLADNAGVGWLFWAWYKDNCNLRELTTNGHFNTLSTIGNDIVYNATYGLQAHAHKTNYFLNGGACTTSINELTNENSITVYPDPVVDGTIHISGLLNNTKIEILDLNGKLIQTFENNKSLDLELKLKITNKGVYVMRVTSGGSVFMSKICMQ